ncbi:glycosyltransferase family 2 protein [Lysinibacter sp. HNR]|uniref:glycosyltransferase family 2 protein n=1 Tax=Lysinibacter sp. HNR TaxID=3031408 RepID=UPI002434AB85|nr:glycosyltransferase family 2 protein [Lysinibacter sp. HNR]WGD38069.1 glycosyltransferase family 2 protein [Lysinibacter sp. HNR]
MSPAQTLVVQSVLFHNDPDDIIKAAEALSGSIGHATQSELISTWTYLVGDCSPKPALTDDHLSRIEDLVARSGGVFRYEAFGENLGSAAGQNRLADLAESDLILILNPDAIVAPDTVTNLNRSLVDGVGLVEARQLPQEHPKDYEKYLGDTSWASTACALTIREAFEKVGGFDASSFFLYCDDVDYSWQLKLRGYRVVYEPSARVFHDKRLTLSGDWPVSTAEIYYSAEAALILAYKYSRNDIVENLLHAFEEDTNEHVQKARRVFLRRREEGQLPEPCDTDHRVARFVAGNYAVHRF